MKNKVIRFIIIGIISIPLISLLFITVPASHAQTSQPWSDPINLSNAGSSTNPALVIDAAGTIHVVWFDQFDGYKYTNSTDGKNWTDPKIVTFPFSPTSLKLTGGTHPEAPVLIADEEGQVHTLWLDKTSIENAPTLYYSKTSSGSDLTSSWTTRMKLADAVMDFDAVLSSKGVLHVGYVSGVNPTSADPVGVFYRQIKGTSVSSSINLYSSQYFRALIPEESNVHLAVTDTKDAETVYMVWDNKPQKHIFLAKSLDGGNLWESAVQLQDAEDSSGQETPYNVNLGVVDNQILLLWQYGQTGNQCDSYSLWSTNGSDNFGPPEKLNKFIGCPQDSQFISVNKDFSLVSLKIFDDITFLAWNGLRWSEPRIQNELTAFINPATLDSVILGCQQISAHEKQLFVVGCDKGNGGDIWFSSRTLGSIEDWFPSSSVWTAPSEEISADQQISELTSVADDQNNIHTFWVQTPSQNGNEGETTIQYSVWNGKDWSQPVAVISGLEGIPLQLKANADSLKRLTLSWVDSKTGDMNFSWAAEDRASFASEWEAPQYIPSISQVNSAPDILVDDLGKIIVVYAIPINEQRGIYFVESENSGATWATPFQIFDAVNAGWDIVDQPDISLTGDGRLHILFNRYSTQGELRQSKGLFYSQSANGGATWTDPEVVSEQSVEWSSLVAYGKSGLYRLWQEYRQSELVSFQQTSQDNGVTWAPPLIISSVDATTSLTGQTTDKAGNLYFLQLTGDDNRTLLSYVWNGSSWTSQEPKDLYLKNRGVPFSLTVGISSEGNLLASFLVVYPHSTDSFRDSIFHVSKSIHLPEDVQSPFPAIVATAEPTVVVTEVMPNISGALTQVSSQMDIKDLQPSLPINKNLVGVLLLIGLLVILVIIFRPFTLKK